MAKKANNSSPFTLGIILKSGMIINLLYLLIVLLLIKMIDGFVDGFSNPQLLQREYYYFYPELFEELPESIENDMSSNSIDGVDNNQPMWLQSSEEDLGIMGTDETDTPYLMEELYLVQDDMRDVKTQLEIIGNEVGVRQPDGATCSEYSQNDLDALLLNNDGDENMNIGNPCNIITDPAECDSSEYCNYNTTDSLCEGNDELDCTEEYENNGGLIRYSCPWVCQYKNNLESPKVQGGFLLTDSKRLL